jgi:phosphate transport system permease protein
VSISTPTAEERPSSRLVPGVREALEARRPSGRERGYTAIRWGGAAIFATVFLTLIVTLLSKSSSAFSHMGLSILWTSWNPVHQQYGAGPFIVGTLLTTLLALVIAVPIGLGTALFLTEMAPPKLAGVLGGGVEFLAAIPSIVVGFWGLIVLTPIFTQDVEPFLKQVPLLKLAFSGPALGASVLLAGVVLAIMVLPTIVALSRIALKAVPREDREAGRALGATRWQVSRRVVLGEASRGIRASVTLAMGRALGEAIAVALVIGNRVAVPHSLLAPASTLGSAVVNFFSEADPGSLEQSAVVALVVLLLVISVAVNAGGQVILRRRVAGRDPLAFPTTDERIALDDTPWGDQLPERRASIRAAAAASLAARRRIGRAMGWLCASALGLSLIPLVAMVGYIIAKGAPAISWTFLTGTPTPPGIPGNGIGNAIVGTILIVAMAIAMAVPVSLGAALFVTERPGRLANALRFAADTLAGAPSIAIGVFAYVIVVVSIGYSAFAGAVALAVLMLPIMMRANEEAVGAVASDLWDAGLALGSRRGRVVRSVVLRTALPGIVSGNVLAVARAVGETAPLLFTIFGSQLLVLNPAKPISALPLTIFSNATQGDPVAVQTAWGAALVLLVLVILLSISARLLASRLNRKAR